MKNIILTLLSITPIISVEELYNMDFNSDELFNLLNELESEGKIELVKGELGYVKLI